MCPSAAVAHGDMATAPPAVLLSSLLLLYLPLPLQCSGRTAAPGGVDTPRAGQHTHPTVNLACVDQATALCNAHPTCRAFGINGESIQLHGCNVTTRGPNWVIFVKRPGVDPPEYTRSDSVNVDEAKCTSHVHVHHVPKCSAAPPSPPPPLPPPAPPPPPPWTPHYTNHGAFAVETLETSLFFWRGAGARKGMYAMESMGCGHRGAGAAHVPTGFANHSYFRVRDLHSGDIVANIAESIGFGFGSSFVDYDHQTLWIFGTRHDRCVNDHACDRNSSSQECLAQRGVWTWSTRNLITFTRRKTDVSWPDECRIRCDQAAGNSTRNFNVDVSRVRRATEKAPGVQVLPSHRYVMVTNTGNLMVNNQADGNLTRGWYTMPIGTGWFGCPSIQYLPSDGFYYVIEGGKDVTISRSKTLFQADSGERMSRDEPFIRPSPADGLVAPFANFSASVASSNASAMLADLRQANFSARQWDFDSNDADVCCESWGGAAEVTSAFVNWGISSQDQGAKGNLRGGPTVFQGIATANVTLEKLLQSYFVSAKQHLTLKSDDDDGELIALRNISFSCDPKSWGTAAVYCVNSSMAQYLTLSGDKFGYDVDWAAFPEAVLWKSGDGLTWSDDIPICHHNPSAASLDNISSFIASIRHYKLATTYCSFDVDGKDWSGGGSGGDASEASIGEWGYDWYATSGPSQPVDCNRLGRGSCGATTRRAAYECVKAYYQCRLSILARSRQKQGALSTMLGHMLWHHAAATWSALTVIGSEVGENINSINAHFAFNRGAARQFALPWFIDFSDWNAGFLHGFTRNTSTGTYEKGNDGHSISLRERVAYLTYMSGANRHKMEDPSLFLNNNETTQDGYLPLSPIGESAQRTHKFFVEHPDRGTPYVPIAIMVPSAHGWGIGYWNIQHARGNAMDSGSRTSWEQIPGQPYGPFGLAPQLPYTDGDNFTNLLFEAIWPEGLPMNIGTNFHNESKRLVSSKYTEMWDVLIDVPVSTLGSPDWSYNLLGCTTCGGYRVVVLTGDIDFNESDAAEPSQHGALGVRDALWSWVMRGGVLVMTAPVLLAPGNNFSAAPFDGLNLTFGGLVRVPVTGVRTASGSMLRKLNRTVKAFTPTSATGNATTTLLSLVSADGGLLPAVTSTAVGNGEVLVIHQPSAADLDTLGTLDWLLDSVTDDINPFSLSGGSIQSLLNRRETGWNVTLINNLGVTKLCGINNGAVPKHCSPDIIDPSKSQTITVTLKPEHARLLGNLSVDATEHVTGNALKIVQNSVTVTVPAGSVRVIGLEHAQLKTDDEGIARQRRSRLVLSRSMVAASVSGMNLVTILPRVKSDDMSASETSSASKSSRVAVALMAIFNATGGRGWGGHGKGNHGWGSSSDPCSWAGVCCRVNATEQGCLGANTPNVTGLNLGFNQLSGTLPSDQSVWGALPHLRFLSARSNKLSGTLPTELRLLIKLEDLNLRRNRISGTLSAEWTPLQRLRHFSVSVVNRISGTIPASFGSLHELGEGQHGGLDLSNNRLHGSIPASFSSLRHFHEFWPGQGGNIGLGGDGDGNVYDCPVPPITLANGTVTTTYAHCGGLRLKLDDDDDSTAGRPSSAKQHGDPGPLSSITIIGGKNSVATADNNLAALVLKSDDHHQKQNVGQDLNSTHDHHQPPRLLVNGLEIFRHGEGGTLCYRIPMLVSLPWGTLLAFAEARNWIGDGCNPGGNPPPERTFFWNQSIVMKHSTDRGYSWSNIVNVTRGHDFAVIYDIVTRRLVLQYPEPDHFPWMGAKGSRSMQMLSEPLAPSAVVRWGSPTLVQGMGIFNGCNVGPGGGALQLRHHPIYRGRLLFCGHANTKSNTSQRATAVWYSDNHGASWERTAPIEGFNECNLVERENGTVLLDSRNQAGPTNKLFCRCRLAAISTDGGATFGQQHTVPSLNDIQCQGSMISSKRSSYRDPPRVPPWYFSGPNDKHRRKNLTLSRSTNEGTTWQPLLVLWPEFAEYSSLTLLPEDRDHELLMAVAYEHADPYLTRSRTTGSLHTDTKYGHNGDIRLRSDVGNESCTGICYIYFALVDLGATFKTDDDMSQSFSQIGLRVVVVDFLKFQE